MQEPQQRPPRQPLVAPGQIEHHIPDLTVTAAGDVTLAALQEKLAENGQWLPIDGDPQLALSRLVETNSSGPLRLGFGAWRDLLLGVQFTTASGQFITVGARTMKNVAGYDVTKLMVGQHGLFGTIKTVTTRSYKRPDGAILATFPPMIETVAALLTTPARPQWAMAKAGEIYCGYLGDERTLDFYQSCLADYGAAKLQRQSLEQDIEFRNRHWLGNRKPTVFRASVPPARVLQFMSMISDATSAADPIFGIVVGSISSSSESEAIDRATAQLGGTVVYGDPDKIRSFLGASGDRLRLLERLQSAFDE
jgi:hypothetical protein